MECIEPLTVYPEGNGNIIEFTQNGTYIATQKGTVTLSNRYNLVLSTVCNPAENPAINQNGSLQFVKVEHNSLQLSTPRCYADGAITTYRRIQ